MIARHGFTFASTVIALCFLSGLASAANAANASVFLEDHTWTELRDLVAAGTTTIIVPIGGTEQSGPAIALG
ncbi:creatininase family protein, partial [Mesorhizobium sp. M7D.F.Ca.US.004.03.1.1]